MKPLVALRSPISRIALAFMAMLLLANGLTLLFMHNLAQRALDSDARAFVATLSKDLASAVSDDGIDGLRAQIETRLGSSDFDDVAVALKSPEGRLIEGNLADWPGGIGAKDSWLLRPLNRTGHREAELFGLATWPLPGGYDLLVGKNMDAEGRLRSASLDAIALALLAAGLFALGGAWLLTRMIGGQVERIASVADRFSEGDLTGRMPVRGSDDAFDHLSRTINHMLDRIERLFGELRTVTDSMAHDLRSPVGRMKASLEHAVVETGDARAIAALGKAIEEADGLQRLLNTALEISRAEAGIGREQFAAFNVAELLRDIAEVYGPLAEDKGFAIEACAEERLDVFAHRDMLTRALSNLVDNALKYASGGRRIALLARRGGGEEVELEVCDDGPGIPETRLPEALKRFGRLDAARTEGGAGLGLSLVGSIAALHGGETQLLANQPKGLRAVLRLPVGREG